MEQPLQHLVPESACRNMVENPAKPSLGLNGVDLPPVAPLLMQALRAVGYTAPAALADLVDNSIAAGATGVAVRFAATPEPFVAVIDDGRGMDENALVAAMRFGSRDPREIRDGLDLGRFGLGLKTASLSQCRRLTVASLCEGNLSVAVWDLDTCDIRRSWWLERPGPDAVLPEVLRMLEDNLQGTAVVWEKLDRIIPPVSADPQKQLDVVMEGALNHLALAFHRFLAGDVEGAFRMEVNGRDVPVLDPFLNGHPRGQGLHSETIWLEGKPVTVTPYVLPFPSRLRQADLERAGGRESLKTAHGFYIYRGGRLVVPGGWFRIVPADELIRLARIRVEVPVDLDHIWKVDVRKTTAEPPPSLKPHLKRVVGDVTKRARRVYTHRGTRADPDRISVWSRIEHRDGAASWQINRDHPFVVALLQASNGRNDIESLLRLVENALPLHDIHVHLGNDLPIADPADETDADLESLARRILEALSEDQTQRTRLLERLHLIDPFSRHPDVSRAIAERLR